MPESTGRAILICHAQGYQEHSPARRPRRPGPAGQKDRRASPCTRAAQTRSAHHVAAVHAGDAAAGQPPARARDRVVGVPARDRRWPYASAPSTSARFDARRLRRWKSRWSTPRRRRSRPRPTCLRRRISTVAAIPTPTAARRRRCRRAAKDNSDDRARGGHAESRGTREEEPGDADASQGDRDPSRLPDRDPRPSAGHAELPTASEMMQRTLEAMRLEAQIAKDMDAYQKRPKRRFVGARAPSTVSRATSRTGG